VGFGKKVVRCTKLWITSLMHSLTNFGRKLVGLVNLPLVSCTGGRLALLLYPPSLCKTHPFWMSEPDNCSVERQLGSTHNKGLPVLCQWLPPGNAALLTVTSMLRVLRVTVLGGSPSLLLSS